MIEPYHLIPYWSRHAERCGFVLADNSIIEVENIAEDPTTQFEISQEVFENYESTAIATWHSHTATNSNLSLEDYATFLALPEFTHWIISKNRVVSFIVEDGAVLIQEVFSYDNN